MPSERAGRTQANLPAPFSAAGHEERWPVSPLSARALMRFFRAINLSRPRLGQSRARARLALVSARCITFAARRPGARYLAVRAAHGEKRLPSAAPYKARQCDSSRSCAETGDPDEATRRARAIRSSGARHTSDDCPPCEKSPPPSRRKSRNLHFGVPAICTRATHWRTANGSCANGVFYGDHKGFSSRDALDRARMTSLRK